MKVCVKRGTHDVVRMFDDQRVAADVPDDCDVLDVDAERVKAVLAHGPRRRPVVHAGKLETVAIEPDANPVSHTSMPRPQAGGAPQDPDAEFARFMSLPAATRWRRVFEMLRTMADGKNDRR